MINQCPLKLNYNSKKINNIISINPSGNVYPYFPVTQVLLYRNLIYIKNNFGWVKIKK